MVGVVEETHTAVETEYAVCLEYVHESAEHALRAIWGASLKADLRGVSSRVRTCRVGLLPLLSTRLAWDHVVVCIKGLGLVLRSKGCVTEAAKHDAEPPNQKG